MGNMTVYLNRWIIKAAVRVASPLGIGLIMVLIQMLTAGRYGIFGDEFYYIECAGNLDFGYVDHPPLVAVITQFSLILFGKSLLGLRFFAAMAGLFTVLLTAAIAGELGGGRFARSLSAFMILASIAFPAIFNFFSMNGFDVMFCCLIIYLLLKILKGAPTWNWILLGGVAGLGLMNKYSVLVLGFAITVGLLLTSHRRHFRTPWPYLAAALALLIFLPHVIWQMSNGLPTMEFMKNVQLYKNQPLSIPAFFLQLILAMNPVSILVWVGGMLFLLFRKRKSDPDTDSHSSSDVRWLGITVAVFFFVYLRQTAKVYYLFPIMPILLAAGAVGWEDLLRKGKFRKISMAYIVLLLISATLLMPLAVPVLQVDNFVTYSKSIGIWDQIKMERGRDDRLPLPFHYRFGWEELTDEVVKVYRGLSDSDRKQCTIYGGWYNLTGALNYYGPKKGLPRVISGHNNHWIWGPGDNQGTVLIAAGVRTDDLKKYYHDVTLVAVSKPRYGVQVVIHLCRNPKYTIDQIWHRLKIYI